MSETIDQFYDRIYVDFVTNKVSVWSSKWNKDEGKKAMYRWDMQTTKNYIDWLETQQPIRVKL